MLRAVVMLLRHIGRIEKAEKLEKALDVCMFEEAKIKITGRPDGATNAEFAEYVMSKL